MSEVMAKIQKNHIKFKKNLDPKVRVLITKILQIDPQKRPTTEEILKSHELVQLSRQFDIEDQLDDQKEKLKKPKKR